jgi:hypothetical protein
MDRIRIPEGYYKEKKMHGITQNKTVSQVLEYSMKTWQETEKEWLSEGRRDWRSFIYQPVKNGTNTWRRENEHVNETTINKTNKIEGAEIIFHRSASDCMNEQSSKMRHIRCKCYSFCNISLVGNTENPKKKPGVFRVMYQYPGILPFLCETRKFYLELKRRYKLLHDIILKCRLTLVQTR